MDYKQYYKNKTLKYKLKYINRKYNFHGGNSGNSGNSGSSDDSKKRWTPYEADIFSSEEYACKCNICMFRNNDLKYIKLGGDTCQCNCDCKSGYCEKKGISGLLLGSWSDHCGKCRNDKPELRPWYW